MDRIADDEQPRWRQRIGTLALVGMLHLAVLLVVLAGSGAALPPEIEQPLQLINLRPPSPPARKPKPAKPAKPAAAKPVRTAAPPHPTVKPEPAPPPAEPAVATQGGDSAGSGTAAGAGTGTGIGAGGAPNLARHAIWIGTDLGNDDYPEAAKLARLQGVVELRYTVRTDGKIENCRIARSSGSAELDRLTCALLDQRSLYVSALDATGRPVPEPSGRRFTFTMRPHQARR